MTGYGMQVFQKYSSNLLCWTKQKSPCELTPAETFLHLLKLETELFDF